MFVCIRVIKCVCISLFVWSMAVVLCPSVGVAQTQALSFSSTASGGIDGFNNGNTVLASTITVPVTLGVFDAQTNVLSPLATDTEFTFELLDAEGNPHPELFIAQGKSIVGSAGASVMLSSLALVWAGNGITTASVVARSVNGLLLPVAISLIFDPALSPDLRVTTVLLHDVNNNGVADMVDTRITSYQLGVYPLAMEIAANADGVYPLYVPRYNGGFPLHIYPLHGSGWRPCAFDRSEGIRVENAATDTLVVFMEPVPMTVDFSGFRHELFGGVLGMVADSVLTLSNFTTTATVSLTPQAPHWYTTGLATPNSNSEAASFSIAAFCTHDMFPWRALGTLSIACSTDVETVTPDFSAGGSAMYNLTIYHKGEEVYTEDNLSGAAVVLPRAVRRWGVDEHSFVVEEVFPREIGVGNGMLVVGDRIVLTPQVVDASLGDLSAVEIAGAEMKSLALYRHELRLFEMVETCTGNALFSGVQHAADGVQIVGGTAGAAVFSPPSASAKNLAVEWTAPEPVVPSTQAWITIEARTADETLSLGAIALFRDGAEAFSCRALLSSYGIQERAVSVYNNGELVATATTTDETVAQYGVLPIKCSASTQYGKQGYRLFWENAVGITLPDAQYVEGDQLVVSFRAVNRPHLLLQDIVLHPRDGITIIVRPGALGNDVLLLAATITITGKVFDDSDTSDGVQGVNEKGRANRRVFIYGDIAANPLERDTLMTDSNGTYHAVYQAGHWAPERVRLEPLIGWFRTTPALPPFPILPANPDYDVTPAVGDGKHNATIIGLNFGEVDEIQTHEPELASTTYGNEDGFNTDTLDERGEASPALSMWLAEGEHTALEYFDIIPRNQWFGHSLPVPSTTANCIVTSATISMRLRAGQSIAYNDAVVVQQDGRRLWSAPIAALTASRTWFADRTETLTLDLTALPQRDGTTVNLATALQNGEIDIVISDDTGIDYLTYLVHMGCVPPSSSLLTSMNDERGDVFDTRIIPNPNTGTGHIEFSIAQNEVVTVSVVDVVQREVVRLLDAIPLPLGKHTLGFSLPFLPTGTYFLQVTAGSAVSSYRFVLLR